MPFGSYASPETGVPVMVLAGVVRLTGENVSIVCVPEFASVTSPPASIARSFGALPAPTLIVATTAFVPGTYLVTVLFAKSATHRSPCGSNAIPLGLARPALIVSTCAQAGEQREYKASPATLPAANWAIQSSETVAILKYSGEL